MVLYRQSSRPDHDCIYYFIYDELKKQIWYSIQVSVTLLFCTTTCWQAHWTSWSLLQVMFRSRGPLPTVTQLEATLGDRIDLRISGQPEEPYPLNERQAKVFFIFSLMKQVLKFPNKSTESNDLIKNHSQKSAEEVDYIPVQCRDSENASQNCNLARHGVFKAEDRFQIHTHASNTTDQERHFVQVEACYKASSRRSRSRKSNESPVDSSCTSLECTKQH